MQHTEQNIRYQRNLLFSFYLSIALLSSILTVLFISLFFLKIFTVPTNDLAEKAEEKRYTVELDRREEKKKQPKENVENINENKKESKVDRFLSDFNSQSADTKVSNNPTGEVKTNESEFTSLELKEGRPEKEKDASKKRQLLSKNFDTESIFGEKEKGNEAKKESGNFGKTSVNRLNSRAKTRGAERLSSDFSLSTYQWDFAPYIRIIREKVRKFISPPPAYYLGLLRGQTKVRVTIAKNGELLEFKMLEHNGSKPLQKTTEDVMIAIFKLPPLPPNFPDKTLTLTGILYYR